MKPTRSSEPTPQRFEREHDLHLFLLNNLEIIEPELRLYGRESLDGLQFKCLGKKLDLLTEDTEGGLLAIEVKFNYGTPEALGQLLGYMAVINRLKRFSGRLLRGMIVCRKASDHLMIAAEDLGSVTVCEYTEEPRIVHVLRATNPVRINDWTQ